MSAKCVCLSTTKFHTSNHLTDLRQNLVFGSENFWPDLIADCYQLNKIKHDSMLKLKSAKFSTTSQATHA
jgi:5-methylcytosine-specific restriction endonuclease McrA